jgi:inner membrane protein
MQAVTELYAQHAMWFWIALGAALLAIEILTGSGWLLWAAASAGAIGVVTRMAGLSPTTSLLIFAGLTMASTLLARRYMPRQAFAEGGDINDNIGRLVGQRGSAVAAFKGGAGRVFIDGKEWAAELAQGEALKGGAGVEVVGVRGVHLLVREAAS